MSCPACDRAERELHHEYDMKCPNCNARYLATRPEFTASFRRRVITTTCRQMLQEAIERTGYEGTFLDLNRAAFGWSERMAAMREKA